MIEELETETASLIFRTHGDWPSETNVTCCEIFDLDRNVINQLGTE